MFTLVLVCALVGQSLTAPSNCGTPSMCDNVSGRQMVSGGSKGGYSSYSKWGSSSSWSSGNLDSGYSTLGGPARLETFDDGNVIGTSGGERPGSWRDEKSYVTNDGKGKIDYKASQTITGNSFKKYAESSYSYGNNAHHEVQPHSQIIHSSQFESQIQDVQHEMQAFIGKFSFGAGSVVNQNTLDQFKLQAQQLTNQITNLCDRAEVGSNEYRQLQDLKQSFDHQVEQTQRELMNYAFDSSRTEHISGSVTTGNAGGQYVQQPYYPSTPIYQIPTVNPQLAQSQKIQQECNNLRKDIESFYQKFVTANFNSYDREDTLAAFQTQVNTQVAAIEQQIANLRVESVNFEHYRKFVDDMNRTFESYVENLNAHLQDCERRIREEQLKLIEDQDKIQRQILEQERAESQRKHDEAVRLANDNARREQQIIEERLEFQKRQEEEQRQRIQQRPQPEIHIQPALPQVQAPTPLPNVETTHTGVGGSYSHKYDVHVSGSQHHEVSASGIGGSASGQHIYQPIQIGPHIDITDINNKMNQEYNLLLSSISGLSSYSMQLTESNHESINAQFQREVENLRRKIDNLCQQSSQYHNNRVLQAAEDLKKNLEKSLQYFQQECNKVSSSGSSSWSTGGRYTNIRPPHINNVEISHSKSTEIEVSHGGRGNAAGQVICVEQYANQPCIEPVRIRREAGGYNSQQHASDLDEYKPRRNNYQRRRTYEPEAEDYSQQHADLQPELNNYSQRQTARNENFRRHGYSGVQNQAEDLTQQESISTNHRSQKNQYRRPYSSRYGLQESEDLSQQYVQNVQSEDLQLYQKPRSQITEDLSQQYVQNGQSENLQSYQKPRSQRTENLSQQYVQSGQSEDLELYQKPRNQRTEKLSQQLVQSGRNEDLQSYQKPRSQVDDRQQGNQHIQAANLQREPSSVSTGRTLLDQRLVVDEPQEFVKPIVKPGRSGSQRGVDNYTLEMSGFYDNSKSQENSNFNDNLQQSYEKPTQTQTDDKSSEEIQKPRSSFYGNFTLENSGFDDYQNQRGHYTMTKSPSEQVTTFKDLVDSQKSEDLTLQQSGFFENGQQSNLSQQNYSTPQSTEQMSFGPEVQPGRQSSLNLRPERINSYYDDRQRNRVVEAPSSQNREYEQKNKHPVDQYIHNLPQQNGPPSTINIIDLESDTASDQLDNANSQSDNILSSQDQESVVTAYPPVRPVPKPNPRYTRPWQVSQNVPQKAENEHIQPSANQNVVIGSNISFQYSKESSKPSEPHRGDLPGISEPTTEEPAYITSAITHTPTVGLITQAPSTETPSQEIVEPEVSIERTPCFFNRCQQNQFDQLGQSYYYRQQNQHNIRFSQQSTYNNQQNLGINSDYQLYNPFYQQNSHIQFDQQVNPINYVPEGGYTYTYTDEQRNHLRINHQGSNSVTQPIAFEQSDLLGLNKHDNSQQQVQQPFFENSSDQRKFSQHHSTFTFNQHSSKSTDNGFPAKVIPVDETQSRNFRADIESTIRPTFWKRVGRKLSNVYAKVKDSAGTVYG